MLIQKSCITKCLFTRKNISALLMLSTVCFIDWSSNSSIAQERALSTNRASIFGDGGSPFATGGSGAPAAGGGSAATAGGGSMLDGGPIDILGSGGKTSGSGPLDLFSGGGLGLGGESAVGGLKDFYIFGPNLSATNKDGTLTLEKHNDPLIGQSPNLPPELAKWPGSGSTAGGSGSVLRAAIGGVNSVSPQGGVGNTVAQGAMGTMYNTATLQNNLKVNELLVNPNTVGAISRMAINYADPAAARALDETTTASLNVAQALSSTSSNLDAAWGDTAEGKLRKISFQACLDRKALDPESTPLLDCTELFNGPGGAGGGLLGGGGGLAGILGGAGGGGFGDFGSLLGGATGGGGLNVGSIMDGFTGGGGGGGGSLTDMAIDAGTSAVSGAVSGLFKSGPGASGAPARSGVATSGNTRLALRADSEVVEDPYCAAIAQHAYGKADCKSSIGSVYAGANVKYAVRNSYLIFPAKGGENDAVRDEYVNYFGDHCIACVTGGTDPVAGPTNPTTTRIAHVILPPTMPAGEHFKKVNMLVYESLREALFNKCEHDNQILAEGPNKKGAEIFRVSDANGTVPDTYDDGDFWRSSRAATTTSASSDLTAREVLQYLSFPGFKLTAAMLDGIYEIVSEKDSISMTSTGSGAGAFNSECMRKLGPLGKTDWYAVEPAFYDAKVAALLKREIKAILTLSQRISLGKVYHACEQALTRVQSSGASAENNRYGQERILDICTGSKEDAASLQSRRVENLMEINKMMDRLYEELAAGSGKSGSAMAKSFKGGKSEANRANN